MSSNFVGVDRLSTAYAKRIKRALDAVLSASLLIAGAPLVVICATSVLLDDGLPIFYNQTRSGYQAKPFRLYKLRTMKVGTDGSDGGYPKESAITSVGAVLRRTSLDELPQLFNILKGDMSFVGPRPALPSQVFRYTPRQKSRLLVKPGLTGLAQVRHRNDAPWSVRIDSDLQYIAKLSVFEDLKIVLRTVPAVLKARGHRTGQSISDVDDLGATDARD